MFEGIAATGLPKDWRNALLVAAWTPAQITPTVSEFLNTWSGAALGALENKVTTSAASAALDAGHRRAHAQSRAPRAAARTSMSNAMSHTVYPSLRNKRVVVTGGGSSIGAAIVESFAQQGAHVAFLDIAQAESRELERRLADRATPPRYYACDLTDVAAIRALFPRIRDQLGPIDVLINNAANDDRHSCGGHDACLLGRAHRSQSAALFLLRAGSHRRHEGGGRRSHRQSGLGVVAPCPAQSRDLSNCQGRHRRTDARPGARPRRASGSE